MDNAADRVFAQYDLITADLTQTLVIFFTSGSTRVQVGE